MPPGAVAGELCLRLLAYARGIVRGDGERRGKPPLPTALLGRGRPQIGLAEPARRACRPTRADRSAVPDIPPKAWSDDVAEIVEAVLRLRRRDRAAGLASPERRYDRGPLLSVPSSFLRHAAGRGLRPPRRGTRRVTHDRLRRAMTPSATCLRPLPRGASSCATEKEESAGNGPFLASGCCSARVWGTERSRVRISAPGSRASSIAGAFFFEEASRTRRT